MVTSQEVVFREAEGSDAPAFLEFMAQVATESDFLVMDEGGLDVPVETMAAILETHLESTDQLCLVALVGDHIIGTVTVRTPRQEKINHIGDVFLAIRKSYWEQGLGRILLEEMLDWTMQEGVLTRLELTVQTRNKVAVHLYQKLGFEIEGTKRRGAKSKEGEWLDLYYMGQLLETHDTW